MGEDQSINDDDSRQLSNRERWSQKSSYQMRPMRNMFDSNKSDEGVPSPRLQRYTRKMATIPVNNVTIEQYGSRAAVEYANAQALASSKYIIHPFCYFRFFWDVMSLIMLLANVVVIPYGIAYQKGDEFAWNVFKLTSDLWFVSDIVLNFHTAVIVNEIDGEILTDGYKIRNIYLRSWFLIDLVSAFPFDTLVSLWNFYNPGNQRVDNNVVHPGFKAFQLLRITKLMSLARLLRLSKFVRYLKQWQEVFINMNLERAIAIVKLFNLLLSLFYVNHFNACLQYMVPMLLGFPEQSWPVRRGIQGDNVTAWEKYTRSTFRSASMMFCTGYGEDTPHTVSDIWVAWWCNITGAGAFGLFIGHAFSLIQYMDTCKNMYKEKFIQVRDLMEYRKLPSSLVNRIVRYYGHRFQGKMFDEEQILSEFNYNLRTHAVKFSCKHLLMRIPFFRTTEERFIEEILHKLDFQVYLSGDIILREGYRATKVYFIDYGNIKVYCEGSDQSEILEPGNYFGEKALLQYDDQTLSASAQAEGTVFLYSLSRDDFQAVLKNHPFHLQTVDRIRVESENNLFTTNASSVFMNRQQHPSLKI